MTDALPVLVLEDVVVDRERVAVSTLYLIRDPRWLPEIDAGKENISLGVRCLSAYIQISVGITSSTELPIQDASTESNFRSADRLSARTRSVLLSGRSSMNLSRPRRVRGW